MASKNKIFEDSSNNNKDQIFVSQIVFEGVAKELPDPYRKYRGYVAVDSIMLKPGSECKGHCTFEGGFCGWTNEANDDFDWALVSLSL